MALPLYAGRYQVEELLGRGGMGVVYRATDLRTGGAVAVKVIAPALATDPAYLERLRREARITASLTSPRVVRVFDLDEHEGAPFLVMEYVAGPTLEQVLIEAGRFPAHEAVRICLEVARALEAAHDRGIVHRDLKPDNIKLADGQVKVLDFGIARTEEESGLTLTGNYLGTPHYSAPERIGGHSDIRSDIYALGAILYRLLTGRPPFAGPTPIATLMQHATAPLPEEIRELPESVQGIISRCMAKSPTERYQTPAELVTALSTALRSLPEEDAEAARGSRGARQGSPRGGPSLPPTIPVAQAQRNSAAAETTPLPSAAAPTRTLAVTTAAEAAHVEGARGADAARGTRRLPWLAGGLAVLLLAAVAAVALIRRNGRGEETSAPAPPSVIVYHLTAERLQVATLAGTGASGVTDGPGDVAQFIGPQGIALGADGTLFVVDGGRIRRISRSGEVVTIAGAEEQGFVDGSAVAARFDTPGGIAVDGQGVLYIADRGNHRIRTLSPDGVVRTLAGTGEVGLADGPGNRAQFNYPSGVAVDAEGTVYVADSLNNRIRRIAPDGTVSTLAGGGERDELDGPAARAQFAYPRGIAVDAAGTVFVADSYNARIRSIARDGNVRTVAGSGASGGDDGRAALATFSDPIAVAVDRSGTLYVLDGSSRPRVVTAAGEVMTLAGGQARGFADGAAQAALFDAPAGVAAGPDGRVYIADTDNKRIRVVAATP